VTELFLERGMAGAFGPIDYGAPIYASCDDR